MRLKILMITSEWPTQESPERTPFLVTEVNQLRKHGVEIDVFAFAGKKNVFNYIKEWFVLRHRVDLRDYDIVHAEWGQSALLALPKCVPLLVTFRGSDLVGIVNNKGKYTISGKVLRFISNRIALIADKVIIVSESLSKYLPKVPYTVVPVCLDTSIFRPMEKLNARRQLHLPLESKLVLFPSNPDRPEKRYHLAKSAVEKLGNDTEIVFTRNVPHNQMALYYNACDVMIITSSHEGSPTVVYEALACDLPIVSLDVGDVRQRIGMIKGCQVCEQESPEEISKCLQEILRNPRRIDGDPVRSEFTTDNFCQTMIEIYQSCL